jgi:hypothetical protein
MMPGLYALYLSCLFPAYYCQCCIRLLDSKDCLTFYHGGILYLPTLLL